MRRMLHWLLLLLTAAASGQENASGDSSIQLPDSTVIIDSVNVPWTFVPLGPDNVTSLVLEDVQPWVLYFHSGLVYKPFSEAASQLRGLVQFGLVHREDRRTAELLRLDTASNPPLFRALPFGSEGQKLTQCLDTEVFDSAIDHASASVPADSIVRLTDEAALKQLLSDGASSIPSKFTVLFTIRDATPTLLQRVLSKKLSHVYNFGLIARASQPQPLAGIGLGSYAAPIPGLLVLQPRPGAPAAGRAALDISRMDESGIADEDELVYAEALRYLVEYNRQFRSELPGDNRAGDPAVLWLGDLLRRERLAFNIFDWREVRERGKDRAEL